jgi:E3 ubiquitin-protein ligase UBR4
MDTLRLTSISRVCPLLVPKVRLGGSALPGLIQEFTALLRAACKIALHRRGNFISFLECHGKVPPDIRNLFHTQFMIL